MENQEILVNVWALVTAIIGAVLSGAFVGLAGAVALVRFVRTEPALVKAIEGLTVSVPAERLKIVNSLGKGLVEVGLLVDEVTDGVPADSKPPAQS